MKREDMSTPLFIWKYQLEDGTHGRITANSAAAAREYFKNYKESPLKSLILETDTHNQRSLSLSDRISNLN